MRRLPENDVDFQGGAAHETYSRDVAKGVIIHDSRDGRNAGAICQRPWPDLFPAAVIAVACSGLSPYAMVFNIRGESFRGKKIDTLTIQTSRIKAPTPTADRLET